MTASTGYYFKWLSWALVAKGLAIVALILWGGIGLSPDEAQYWTWSQQLDWGYYSKPPGIAWQIWLGTQLAGHSELGVRLLSLLGSIGQAYAVYFLALQAGLKHRSAFWSGLIMAFCPLGILGSLLAITDGGCLFFWTLAALMIVHALKNAQAPSPFGVGICVLAGALFKWPIYFFWVFFLLSRWLWFPQQPLKNVLGGMALSLVGLLPSVWWNRGHDFATFRHVSATLQGGHGASGGNSLAFLGSQVLLLSPILFILLVMSLFFAWRQRLVLSPPLVFCATVSAISFALVAFLSLFQKIQGNWAFFAYPTAIIWLTAYACEKNLKCYKWLKMGCFLSIALTASLLFLASLPAVLPYRLNPFKHNKGWARLEKVLEEIGYEPEKEFLVSDKYQLASLLSFYSPQQKRAYFLNLQGMRHNQFSYWPGLEEQRGRTGYFVWVENQPHLEREWHEKLTFYEKALEPYFEKVTFLGFFPLLYQGQKALKGALIFKCEECKDSEMPASELY